MINHVFFLLFYALNAINETCFKGIQDTDHVTIISMKLWCSNSIIGSCNQINYDVIIESVNKASLKWQSRDSALFPLKKSKISLPNNFTQQRPVSSEKHACVCYFSQYCRVMRIQAVNILVYLIGIKELCH